jgi:hypothetical protein
VVTEEVLDRGRAVQVAERLEVDNPDWVIMYGSYSREYVAFPVYPDAPDNSYCSAKDPAQLDDHIRAAERRHGRVRLGRRSHRSRRRWLSYPEMPRRRGVCEYRHFRDRAGSALMARLGSVIAGPGQSSFLG